MTGDSVPGSVLKSKLVQSLPNSDSLRTTVPEAIRLLLGVGKGDTLDWTFDTESREVKVSKAMELVAESSKSAGKRRIRSR